MGRASIAVGFGLALALLGALVAFGGEGPEEWAGGSARRPEASGLPGGSFDSGSFDSRAPWIAVSGGADPASNPYSLVQDLEAARGIFGDGYAFFAGGPGSYTQRGAEAPGEGLEAELAAFFDPRERSVDYVPAPPWIQAPTRSDAVLAALAEAQGMEEPLFLYLGGHGEGGSSPADSVLYLWGGDVLGVPEVAAALESGPRTVRMLVTSCFGGGFADVIYREGDRNAGAGPNTVCGIFAATADREASGCDPNPDRAAQESYVVHLWAALRGEDRDGARLDIDFDGNGQISLLEAHAHARATAQSMDVPMTTSYRYLMAAVEGPRKRGEAIEGQRVGEEAIPMPEEDWVIENLGGRLGVTDDIAALSEHHRLAEALGDADAELERALELLDLHYASLRIALLEVVPFLDDPFHPDWGEALRRHRGELEGVFHDSRLGESYAAALQETETQQRRYEELLVAEALHKRLVMAYEAKAAAFVLRHIGGAPWARWLALRECENGGLPRP